MPETRRHAAIMFTDIVGYTRLMGSDEEKAVDMLSRNRSIHQSCIQKFNGTLIKEIGDGILASFSLASEAVRCAMEIQKECKEQDIPLKIGIHEGEMIFSGSDVIGDGVNIASRLQEDAQEGCINISASVYSNIRNKADIQTELIKEKHFKNVVEPIKVYNVLFKDSEKEEHSIKRKAGSKLPYYILSGVVIVIIAFLIIWKSKPTKPDIAKEKTIAVLPFENMSESDEYVYFGDALTDEIIMQLQKIKDFKVRSITSVMKYKDADKITPEIGEELNVNFVIEGAAQRFQNKVRIRVQLIDAITDEHVWGETYDREWGDIFKLQGDIAKEIASELEIILTPLELDRIDNIPTNNLDAYEFYLSGNEYRRMHQGLDSAIISFKMSIELDPEFALAYLKLGESYHDKTYWSEYFQDTFADSLIIYADKALQINPYLSDGYALKGYYYYLKSDFNNSIDFYEKAIELNPINGTYYTAMGDNYLALGDYKTTLYNYKKAKKLLRGERDEYFKSLSSLRMYYYFICDFDKFDEIFAEIYDYNPVWAYLGTAWKFFLLGEWDKMKMYVSKSCAIDSSRLCNTGLAWSNMYLGDYNEALKYFEKLREEVSETGEPLLLSEMRYAYTLYNLGREDEANKHIDLQIQYSLENIRLKRHTAIIRYESQGDLIQAYAFLGEKEKVYEILYEMEEREFMGWQFAFMQVTPFLSNIWEEEEFKAIIKRQEKKYAEIRAEIDRLEAAGEL